MTDTSRQTLQRLRNAVNKPRVRQWAIGLASFWLALALFAFFVAPPLAKSILTDRLGQALGREVAIASISINPLNLSAQVQGFSVKDRSGEEQFGFEQLQLNFSSFSIAQAGWVVDALQLKGPRVSLVRLADGRYNISDLLDRWRSPSDAKPTALPRFSLNNIQIQDGAIAFDDRPKGVRHTVQSLAFDLPFISSMAYKADVFVHPRFSALVNGAQLTLEGQSKPFAPTHASTLSLQLQALDLAQRTGKALGQPMVHIDVAQRYWYNPNLNSRWFFVPGVIGTLLLVTIVNLTAFAIVREREVGTLEQLLVTPIRPVEFIIGKTVPFFLIGLLEAALVTAIGMGWFRVPFVGNPLLLVAGTCLYLLSVLALGLLISTLCRTQQQAFATNFFLLNPMFILSGFSFPINSMPPVLQWLTFLDPLRYFLVIVRGTFLKGVGLDVLWPQMAALAAIAGGLLTLSVLRFRKSLD